MSPQRVTAPAVLDAQVWAARVAIAANPLPKPVTSSGAGLGLLLRLFVRLPRWVVGRTALGLVAGVGVGAALVLRGWSAGVLGAAVLALVQIGVFSVLLLTWVAFFAGVGRGYLPPLGWAFLTVALAQIAAVMGWGEWFPWAVPALLSGMAGASEDLLGWHSYALVILTGLLGIWATVTWWRRADHVR